MMLIYSSALCVVHDVISLVWCDWRWGSPTLCWSQDDDDDNDANEDDDNDVNEDDDNNDDYEDREDDDIELIWSTNVLYEGGKVYMITTISNSNPAFSWIWSHLKKRNNSYRVFFFTGPPPKKLKYGKLRLGEVTCI